MFHVKNLKQLNIFDPWGHLGPKRYKLSAESIENGVLAFYEFINLQNASFRVGLQGMFIYELIRKKLIS